MPEDTNLRTSHEESSGHNTLKGCSREVSGQKIGARIPKDLEKALLLEHDEKSLASWRCLLSCEPRDIRTKTRLLKIAMILPSQGLSMTPDTWSGHIVLTNRRLAFVEEGLVPNRYAWGSALPFEQITGISSDRELVIRADGLGWIWSLRDIEIEGVPGVRADLRTITVLLRDAIGLRRSEIDREKRDRKRRIESFNSTR